MIRTLVLIYAGVAVSATLLSAGEQSSAGPMRLDAWAVNMSNTATGANARIDIRVDRWSSDAEREQLIRTFFDKGQDGLLRQLQKAPVKGRLRNPGRQGPDPHQTALGWDLRYAWHQPTADGGQRIVIATDRYVSVWEARNQPRTMDYPFTFIEIHLDSSGEGEGKLAVATKLFFNKKKNIVELENYSSEPVRLQNVRLKGK